MLAAGQLFKPLCGFCQYLQDELLWVRQLDGFSDTVDGARPGM
jgi:hypothetical protein